MWHLKKTVSNDFRRFDVDMFKKIFLISLLLNSVHMMFSQTPIEVSLHQNWRIRPTRPLEPPVKTPNGPLNALHTGGVACNMPNTALNVLVEKKMLPDPFFGINEKNLQWLETYDWTFETTFKVDKNMANQEHISLVFKGLDTYARVFLNDSLLQETENAFRIFEITLKNKPNNIDFLKKGENRLRIEFTSPLTKEESKIKKLGFKLPDGTRMFTRKPQFHYGWDWGPRFVTVGITESVKLVAWSVSRIENINVIQEVVNEKTAELNIYVNLSNKNFDGKITLDINGKNYETSVLRPQLDAPPTFHVTIPKPRLWSVAPYGKPNLYDLKIGLYTGGGQLLDEKTERIGLRTIELIRERDSIGESFYFKLNGKPIFAKGANLIPVHFFQEKNNKADYQRIIDDALGANMNMLRVWGGGVYERDDFYKLCDERGILVWQDFMFACAMYPWDENFLKNVEIEATEQVQRLGKHASVALFCGNNEVREAWNYWGWQPRYSSELGEKIWTGYRQIFERILPNVIRQNASRTPYHESSPPMGRYHEKSLLEADCHYWGVWHDEEMFEVFDKKVPRFMSEYGFQSFPNWATIESYTKPDERELTSEVMLLHQKHPRGNQLIKKYANEYYREPKGFSNFVYVSQLVQADGIRRGIESHRRNQPRCMGTLYWQLNDVWQVASWSSVDYFGRWKALHYAVKKSYDDLLISPMEENGELCAYIVSDLPSNTGGYLSTEVFNFAGEKLFQNSQKVDILAMKSAVYGRFKKSELASRANLDWSQAVVRFTLRVGNQVIKKDYFYSKSKHLTLKKPQISWKLEEIKGGFNVELTCKNMAKDVYLSLNDSPDAKIAPPQYKKAIEQFSDNFFDLLPNETYS
ncbi:MAG: exo-beta-D-glucosaminidase, partial [Bacteroidota bacterium]